MSGIWTRNYYNWLTAYYGTQCTDVSATAPEGYGYPIKCHAPDGSWFVPRTAEIGSDYTSNFKQGTDIIRCSTQFITSRPSSNMGANYDTGMLRIAVGYVEGGTSSMASYEDYNMQSYLGGFTLSASNYTDKQYNENTHSYSYKRSFTLTNNTTGRITLNELGLFKSVPTTVNSGAVALCLMYHEIYDEPIELEASESIVITLSANVPIFNYTPYPTA